MYALFYDYVENIVERRAPFREAHLALCKEWKLQNDLVTARRVELWNVVV